MRERWLLLLLVGAFLEADARKPYIGCLFSHGLCENDSEWCYDDGAFGRCLQSYSETSPEELYRHQLGREEMQELEKEMEKLLLQGYRWGHDHTQCILQAMLYAYQTGEYFDRIICDPLKDQDLDSALKAVEAENEIEVDPGSVASIRYTPSVNNPQSDYADEVYYPPEAHQEVLMMDDVIPYVERRSLPRAEHFIRKYQNPKLPRVGFLPRDEPFLIKPLDKDQGSDQNGFFIDYNTPDGFRLGLETKDLVPEGEQANAEAMRALLTSKVKELVEMIETPQQEYPDTAGRLLLQEGGSPTPLLTDLDKGGYSEGGLVFLDGKPNGDAYTNLLDKLGWGFERRERLDVKKPGPQFNTNSFAFQSGTSQSPPKSEAKHNVREEGQKETTEDGAGKPVHKHPSEDHPWPKFNKKELEQDSQSEEHYDLVDTTVAYVEFKDSIRAWKEGSHIIDTVARLMHVPREIFSHERVDRNEVTFKVVEPNDLGLNASQAAKKIFDMKDKIRSEIGVVITSTGIGDKTKLPSAVRLNVHGGSDMYVVLVIVCGVLAALTLSAGVLLLTRRRNHKKLHSMTAVDTEPSKHYQDLCRARMSSKSQQDTATGSVTPGISSGNVASGQRITSLSKESDNSPSSRSSTSSWSEEPALSNMDISTGHMVLTYMEDHLRNKDRLETEWSALCCYEADPCATTIAERAENVKKNRYPNAMPYDHARVLLNELSNITGSDYINASTITDHDPRNPAYIVTQGPLPHTSPDFWQMVWEQGCVVIVMLTRLVESDTVMCHRYWPEEGSELYHIYEVHLVSEHIWCDDYLVRSFYLKNLKTGETRTVTQFHFLSWPNGGVPTSTKALLEFRRKVNKSFRGRSCPIVIHCSDGVGRSGTYCLLDMVLNRMAKGAKEIDIAATLEHIRDQRAGSVATKQQFQLVLSAVAEEVQAILRILPQTQQQPSVSQ